MCETASRGILARLALILLLPALLAACAGQRVWAPEEEVQRALYTQSGASEITLFTVINRRTGAGDHSSMIIDGDHRILYDPAGTWFNRHAPRRNDVHYGVSPQVERVYIDYHARETHDVIAQTLRVTPAQAAIALRAAESQSPAGAGQCAVRNAAILRKVDGLGHLPGSFFPRRLMDAFGEVPGVVTRRIEASDVVMPATIAAATD